MRCPHCTERNSVAAKKCEFCGERFKKKPLPMSVKLAAGGAIVLVAAGVFLSSVVPRMIDPQQNLMRVGKKLAAGPSSPEEARAIKKEFDQAITTYLGKAGSLNSRDLTAALQNALSAAAFEVHVTDLPRGLKVVEIDTVLQASDYLLMKNGSGTRVFSLPGMEVFDEAHILNDSAGPMLALLGHSGGQPPHRPILRTYALLPDYIADETEKLVPQLKGEGNARFDKNGQDVKVELSLVSALKADNIALESNEKDDVVRQSLRWKDARYTISSDYGTSPLAALYTVAQCLRHPEQSQDHAQVLTQAGLQYLKSHRCAVGQPLKIDRVASGEKLITYRIGDSSCRHQIDLRKSGNLSWSVSDCRTEKSDDVASAKEPVASGQITKAALEENKPRTTQATGFSKVSPADSLSALAPVGTPASPESATMPGRHSPANAPARTPPAQMSQSSLHRQTASAIAPLRVTSTGSALARAGSGERTSPQSSLRTAPGFVWLNGAHGPSEKTAQKGGSAQLPPSLPPLPEPASARRQAPQETAPATVRTATRTVSTDRRDLPEKDLPGKREAALRQEKSASTAHKGQEAKALLPAAPSAKEPSQPAQSPGQQPLASARIASDIRSTVKLRSAPSTGARALEEISRNAHLEIICKDNGWYKVRCQGKEGFVYGGLVDCKKASAYTTAVITRSKTLTDGRHKRLGAPQIGDRVVVLSGIQNNKYKVQLANGKTGYVDKDAVDVAVETPQLVP